MAWSAPSRGARPGRSTTSSMNGKRRRRRPPVEQRMSRSRKTAAEKSRTAQNSSPRRQETGPVRVSLVSLGCAKNLIDSEVVLGKVGEAGLAITSSAEDAEVIVINTCGFIDAAKEESLRTIEEACAIKRASGGEKRVVVIGCLAQRSGEEIRKRLPDVDAVLGLGQYEGIGELLHGLVRSPGEAGEGAFRVADPNTACNAEPSRFRLTPPHYAYLRISEGCDNPCTFCAIPGIRGRFRSKPVSQAVAEAEELVASGARELVLISQDTTSYGVDIDGRYRLPELLAPP